MPRINRLSAKSIATLPTGLHSDGGNLYLRVRTAGSRQWVMLYRFGGRQCELGLGGAGPGGMPLAQARERAEMVRRQLHTGVNPLQARAERADAKPTTAPVPCFQAMMIEYIARATPSWKNPKSAAQWQASLETHADAILSLPVDSIDVNHIIAVLDPIWYKLPETAKRVRGRIEAILSLSKTRGHRTGENPAAWRDNLKNVYKPKPKLVRGHFTSMNYEEAPDFIAALQERSSMSALVNEWIVLTVTRATPAVEATWRQVDMRKRTWTISADLMKGDNQAALSGEPHVVPLSARAFEILDIVVRLRITGKPDELLFPSESLRPLSLTALENCRERMGVQVTTHGFRATFRTWAAQETFHEHEIAEKALAHLIGDEVHRAYQRGPLLEKRRALMEDWCAYLVGTLSPDINPFVRQSQVIPDVVIDEMRRRKSA